MPRRVYVRQYKAEVPAHAATLTLDAESESKLGDKIAAGYGNARQSKKTAAQQWSCYALNRQGSVFVDFAAVGFRQLTAAQLTAKQSVPHCHFDNDVTPNQHVVHFSYVYHLTDMMNMESNESKLRYPRNKKAFVSSHNSDGRIADSLAHLADGASVAPDIVIEGFARPIFTDNDDIKETHILMRYEVPNDAARDDLFKRGILQKICDTAEGWHEVELLHSQNLEHVQYDLRAKLMGVGILTPGKPGTADGCNVLEDSAAQKTKLEAIYQSILELDLAELEAESLKTINMLDKYFPYELDAYYDPLKKNEKDAYQYVHEYRPIPDEKTIHELTLRKHGGEGRKRYTLKDIVAAVNSPDIKVDYNADGEFQRQSLLRQQAEDAATESYCSAKNMTVRQCYVSSALQAHSKLNQLHHNLVEFRRTYLGFNQQGENRDVKLMQLAVDVSNGMQTLGQAVKQEKAARENFFKQVKVKSNDIWEQTRSGKDFSQVKEQSSRDWVIIIKSWSEQKLLTKNVLKNFYQQIYPELYRSDKKELNEFVKAIFSNQRDRDEIFSIAYQHKNDLSWTQRIEENYKTSSVIVKALCWIPGVNLIPLAYLAAKDKYNSKKSSDDLIFENQTENTIGTDLRGESRNEVNVERMGFMLEAEAHSQAEATAKQAVSPASDSSLSASGSDSDNNSDDDEPLPQLGERDRLLTNPVACPR